RANLTSLVALREELEALLDAVQRGDVSAADAVDRFAALPVRELGFARLDPHRELRQGAPEAVLGGGKTPAQVTAIVSVLLDAGASSVLVTRASAEARAAVRDAVPEASEDERARAVWVAREIPEACGRVVMVSAGTSDGPVLHEARIRA